MVKSQPITKVRKSKNPITGIINVTGEGDTGKTTFALNSGAEPERIAFIDDDVKGKNIVKQVEKAERKFAYYKNLMKESAKGGTGGKPMRELEFHKYCMGILDELSKMEGQLDVIVWDTWTRFENTFQPYVHSNPQEFRQFYSAMGAIKGAEEWGAAFEYEARVLDVMTEIAPLVILTSHLKKDASKRDVAEAKKPLIQKSFMRIYLRHSVNSPKPTGLFLKRPLKMDFAKGMEPVNVVQRKMSELTWENLLYFWENPVGNTPPTADEQLNEFEISILDGILTKDQKDVLRLAVIDAEREREEEARNAKLLSKAASRNGKKSSIPMNAIQLYSLAMQKYAMDGDMIEEATGVATEELMEMNEEEIAKVWKKIAIV